MKDCVQTRNELKINIYSKLGYYFIVLYIIFVRDSMLFALNSNRLVMEFSKVSIFIFLLIVILQYGLKKQFRFRINDIFFICLLAIILLIGLILNNESIPTYALKFSTIFLGYILARYLDFKVVSCIYIKVIKLVAVVSLIAYSFGDKIGSLGIFPVIYTSTRHEAFTTLFITNIPHLSHLQSRNWGPFWEPGVYQAFLITAILLTLWRRNDNSKLINVLIFTIALITTKSTTGYFILPLVFISFMFEREKLNKKTKLLTILFFIFIYIYAITSDEIFYRVFGKLETFENESRWLTLIYGLNIWIQNILWGVGPSILQEKIIGMHSSGTHISITNTWVFNLAAYGLFIGGLYLWNFYHFAKSIAKNNLSKMILVVMFIVMMSGQNLGGSLFFVYLMFNRIDAVDLRYRTEEVLK